MDADAVNATENGFSQSPPDAPAPAKETRKKRWCPRGAVDPLRALPGADLPQASGAADLEPLPRVQLPLLRPGQAADRAASGRGFSFEEWFDEPHAGRPARFTDKKAYKVRLVEEQKKTGMNGRACVVGKVHAGPAAGHCGLTDSSPSSWGAWAPLSARS